jgi:peptide chain release factor 3
MLKRARPVDPMRAKHLGKALQQLAEEGVARVFKPLIDSSWVVGVIGVLQFEVMADRIRTEYDVPVKFEETALFTARWLSADDPQKIKDFIDHNRGNVADDHDGDTVFLARNAWHLEDAQKNWPDIRFLAIKEQNIAV